jgi:dUTP pyrophosphatase
MSKNIMIKVKLLRGEAKIPIKGTEDAAGYDLYSCEEHVFLPECRRLISTGIALEIPGGYEGQIRPRSGLAAKKGLTVLNSPGTIDADYRGEVKVLLINHSGENMVIYKGDRIAQIVFSKIPKTILTIVDEVKKTKRGSGGFGSTGG